MRALWKRVACKQVEQVQQEETTITTALARVGRELMALLDTPVLLTRLCQLMNEEIGCDASHAFLWQPEETVYLPMAGWGDTPEQWEAIRVLKVPGEHITSLTDRLVAEEVVSITTATARDFLSVEFLRRFGVTASLWVALRRGERLIGILSLEYRGRRVPFSPYQRRLARGIATLTALALANARLLQELAHANRLKSDFLATIFMNCAPRLM